MNEEVFHMPVEISYLEYWPGRRDVKVGEFTFITKLEEDYTNEDLEKAVFRQLGHHDFDILSHKEVHHEIYDANERR